MNDNGFLDRKDFAVYATRVGAAMSLGDDRPEVERLRAATEALWQAVIGSMDEGGDGLVQADELMGCLISLADEVSREGVLPAWAREFATSLFQVLDLDGDGAITANEYTAYLKACASSAHGEETFRRLDADGDGKLTLGETLQLFIDWLTAGDPNQAGNYLLTGGLPDAG